MKVQTPDRFSGPLSTCMERAGIQPFTRESQLFTVGFYRGQMRGHAGRWRDRKALEALLANPKVGDTSLSLAKHYRDAAAELSAKIGGAR